MKPQNPFLISGYYSPEHFCDRTVETATIITALENNRNITLIAPRRMGKTGLIKNAFYRLKEQNNSIATIYLDIYSTQNLNDFVQAFASAVLGQLESKVEKVIKKLGNLRPTFSFDEITGNPKVSIDIAPNRGEATLKEIFEYIQSSDKRCYIAIDEFQQIAEYPEKGVEALLRSYIQFIPNVGFIFAGSKQHIMEEMFLSAKRPFYQSTQTLAIGAIDPEEYYAFAEHLFKVEDRELDRDTFKNIYDLFDGHTYYMQSILNRLYGYSDEQILTYHWDSLAISQIISENEYSYQNLLRSQTSVAINLMKAIAKERVVKEVNAGEFIAKYNLKAASSINSAIKKLIDKELVYRTDEGYIIYDRFMSIWLENQ